MGALSLTFTVWFGLVCLLVFYLPESWNHKKNGGGKLFLFHFWSFQKNAWKFMVMFKLVISHLFHLFLRFPLLLACLQLPQNSDWRFSCTMSSSKFPLQNPTRLRRCLWPFRRLPALQIFVTALFFGNFGSFWGINGGNPHLSQLTLEIPAWNFFEFPREIHGVLRKTASHSKSQEFLSGNFDKKN